MSMASPTLRSSSSTAPGPSLSRSPTSMRARPSTAETLTGTSNTASRSAAPRDVGPASAASADTSGATPGLFSRSGSASLPSSLVSLVSLIVQPPWMRRGARIRLAAPAGDVAPHRLVDRGFHGGELAPDAAVGPFDATIAHRDVGLGE